MIVKDGRTEYVEVGKCEIEQAALAGDVGREKRMKYVRLATMVEGKHEW